jgi:regulatory LuxR family protein
VPTHDTVAGSLEVRRLRLGRRVAPDRGTSVPPTRVGRHCRRSRSRTTLKRGVSGRVVGEAASTVARGGSLLNPIATAADGRTNRQIGAQMHLAEKTVQDSVSTLSHKLGRTCRTDAAAR